MAKIEAVPIPAPTTKRCLYCAEEIQAAAIVCKHCGRDQVHIPARPTFAPIPDPLPPSTPTPKAPVTPPKHAPTMTEVAPGIELRSGSYIHANLMAGERILYQTHIHWVVFLRAFVMLAFGLALLGVIALEPKNFTVCILPGLFFFVMGLVAMVVGVIQIRNIEFALTNRRVIGKRGVLHRHSLELLLTKVEAIRVDQPIAGRLFNYGTVIVTGTGGTHEPFRYIADPLEFRRQVQTQLAQIERQ